MRLKSGDGPLSVYNGNDPSIVNSPKRINTLHNSNITASITSNLTANSVNSNDLITTDTTNTNTLNNVNNEGTVQWCNSALTQERELTNNAKNRAQFNINNTLAASLREPRYGTASSICSESSPDDSLLEYEEAHHSCSSIDASPQDEDRVFDVSDSESLSDEGNLNIRETVQHRGIVNPNYPGFQHLAHTLDYSIKASSDTDFTDDDLEYEFPTAKLNLDANNINNNNNNNNNNSEDIEYKIDSVNRLDSVENIQKVFYDKPVFNIPNEYDSSKHNNCNSNLNGSILNLNQNCVEDSETNEIADPFQFNTSSNGEDSIKKVNNGESPNTINTTESTTYELEKLNLDKSEINPIQSSSLTDHKNTNKAVNERGIEEELKEAIEKLSTSNNLEPSAAKYNIEPNTEQPFNKIQTTSPNLILSKDSTEIPQSSTSMAATSLMQVRSSNELLKSQYSTSDCDMTLSDTFNDNLNSQTPKSENLLYVDAYNIKISDAFLSGVHDKISEVPKIDIQLQEDFNANSKNVNEYRSKMEVDFEQPATKNDANRDVSFYNKSEKLNTANDVFKRTDKVTTQKPEEIEKFCKEDKMKDDKEKDEDTIIPRKKEKIENNFVKKRRDYSQQFGSLITVSRREYGTRNRDNFNRRSVPIMRDKKRPSSETLGGFDVYNIETAMPKIDLEVIESHLRAAREEERRRRTDREEIRRRLAMGSEEDYYNDRPGRKPSLQARLQSGMNLQICFMNETASDTDSPSSDSECPMTNPKEERLLPKTKNISMVQQAAEVAPPIRPASLSIGQPLLQPVTEPMTETDFFTRQARLQTEARMALAQAKEMARMQMEIERQRQIKSPITEMVRHSLEKVGIPFPEERRRLSRQILTEMNVAQLQVIVNDLHTQIETLNELLVKYLMERDDLHMEQDSMLVDIEDLTRYLGAKEQTLKDQNLVMQNNNIHPMSSNLSTPPRSPLAALNSSVKPHLHRIASLVKK